MAVVLLYRYDYGWTVYIISMVTVFKISPSMVAFNAKAQTENTLLLDMTFISIFAI